MLCECGRDAGNGANTCSACFDREVERMNKRGIRTRQGVPPILIAALERWERSGRTAHVYPRKRLIRLNGHYELPYSDALEEIRGAGL